MRDLERDEQAQADCQPMRQMCERFQCVAEGMAQFQKKCCALFVSVQSHHLVFDLKTPIEDVPVIGKVVLRIWPE